MELSQLCVNDNSVIEVSRIRIPNPGNTSSYCEKNWMPVLDLPYHYIKWSDPVELIYVDINCVSSKLLFKGSLSTIPITQRGGSQVLKTLNGWLAITHEVKLFTNKNNCKDAIYHHRFILWDESWKIKKYSKPFSIMGSSIEFVAGMCIYKDKLLISYGFQDNAAYILSTNLQTIMDFMDE